VAFCSLTVSGGAASTRSAYRRLRQKIYVTDCYLPRLGGIETQVHSLACRQLAAGHDVEVVTATPRARHDRTDREVVDGVPLLRTTADLPFELPVHPRASREIRRVLRSARHSGGGYDVAHVHAGVISPFAFAAAPVIVAEGVPMVITVHSLWGYATPAFRLLDASCGWSRWPAVLTAVSDVAAAPLRRVAGSKVSVEVLPNGIDAAAWQIEPEPRDPDDVVIASVMRLAPRKRPLPLLRILHRVRKVTPARVRLRAVIVGEGPQRSAMERLLARTGMADWVELTGRLDRDQLRGVYRRADLFVAPAHLESFGIAALEARTAGLPVIAMAGAGIREFVRPEIEGLLADGDREMSAAIVRLADDATLPRMADHNRAVPPDLTWPRVLQLCERAYQRAAKLATTPRRDGLQADAD
jgi:glycosyltransferase involved in cell wall biosynthesis